MSNFARSTGLVAIGQGAVKATQLIMAVLLVRFFSPAEWNQAAYLLSIYLAAVAVGTFNLQHGIIFFMPRVDPWRRRALVAQNVGVLVVIGLAIAVALTLAAPALSGGRLGDGSRLPVLGIAIALELPVACTATTLIATRRFGSAALWDLVGTGLIIVCTAAPVIAGRGVNGMVEGLVVVGAVRIVASFAVIAKVLPGEMIGLPLRFLGEQLLYAVPLGLTLGVSMLNRLVDKWLIAAFDPANFGVYAVAAQEVPLLSVLPYAGGAALVSALVDAFRDDDIDVARTHWLHLTMTMSTFVVPMSIGLVLISPELLIAVFTDDFAAGVLPFQLFTLVTLHRVAEYGMLLRAAGRTRDLLAVAAVTFVANGLLAGVGAATAGMVGASLGTLVASGIGWMFVMRKIAGILQTRFRDAFAWRAWMSTVLIAAVAAVATSMLTEPLSAPTAVIIGAKLVVFLLLYGAGLWRWRRSRLSAAPPAVAVPTQRTRIAA